MYTEERNVQMIVYLLKQYKIHNVIVCPGSGNITFVMTIQNDPFFKIWSVVDERSAVYMACGLAQETDEPVVVTVTNNVAIRNTVPGMTEAYYRNLPILLLSSAFNLNNIENYWPQMLDERAQFNDAQKMTVIIPEINNKEDEWGVGVNINRAFQHLIHGNGGPVHIHYQTQLNRNYINGELPKTQVVEVISDNQAFPELPEGKIAIYVGNHKKWSESLTEEVDKFCEVHNAIVLCDNTSNYHGRYGINPAILWKQEKIDSEMKEFELLIHIGNPSGSYIIPKAKKVWRVDCEGVIRDAFMKLQYVFEMKELCFFKKYNKVDNVQKKELALFEKWQKEKKKLYDKIPELPFSNAYIAQKSSLLVPSGSSVYFAILNTLRCWNLFELARNVDGYSNTGGFGIDGGLSTLIGMSFANPQKLYFGIFGDLGFFFDMNALGNKHLNNNIRIMVINNGIGAEFKTYKHFAEALGDEINPYIAAEGHFHSPKILKHYAEDLGMEYISASNKEEFLMYYREFFSEERKNKSMLFEVFTNSMDEKEALKRLYNIL